MILTTLIQLLRSGRHRITKTRQAMLEIFYDTSQPLSPQNIHLSLKQKGIAVNKTTIYREIDFLLKQKIIQTVKITGSSSFYELKSRYHHHHVICDNCGRIEDIALPEKPLLDFVSRQTKFDIAHHSLEFYGTCYQCQ